MWEPALATARHQLSRLAVHHSETAEVFLGEEIGDVHRLRRDIWHIVEGGVSVSQPGLQEALQLGTL